METASLRTGATLPANTTPVEASAALNTAVELAGGSACPNCRRSWGGGRACQFCRQLEGLPLGVTLASPAKRFGAYLLESVLFMATLGLGYLVWALVVYGRGQTPAKQLLGMRYVTISSGRPSGWGRTFVREMIAKPVVGFLAAITFGIVYFWLIWDRDNQELWDKLVGTVVVDDPARQMC